MRLYTNEPFENSKTLNILNADLKSDKTVNCIAINYKCYIPNKIDIQFEYVHTKLVFKLKYTVIILLLKLHYTIQLSAHYKKKKKYCRLRHVIKNFDINLCYLNQSEN